MASTETTFVIVGRINSRLVVKSPVNEKTAAIPRSMTETLERLGFSFRDDKDNYIV